MLETISLIFSIIVFVGGVIVISGIIISYYLNQKRKH